MCQGYTDAPFLSSPNSLFFYPLSLSRTFFIIQERKKRRKKLKSRRERNRHKALLKMTHHKRQSTPPHTQQVFSSLLPSCLGLRHLGKICMPGDDESSYGCSHTFLSPSPQPPPPPDDDTRDMVDAVHRPPSLGATPYRYSPLEVARNGGIPTFVQERIEERQKKKSDVESSERLSDEVCVCVMRR